MTEVLDTIERELLVAIRRSNARRRRRRTLGIFSGALFGVAAVAGGGVVATVSDTPIEQVLGGGGSASDSFKLAVGERPVRLAATDAAGTPWTVTMYRSQDEWIVLKALPDETVGRVPDTVGRSPLAIATELLDGPLLSIGPVAATRGAVTSYLLVGQVEAQVRTLSVTLGGRSLPAELSASGLRAPIEPPPPEDVLPEGRKMLEQVGDALELRSFAVTVPAGAIEAGTREIEPTVTTKLADGTVRREQTWPLCVSASCGFRPYELPDQDG
ncbi:hypothetical protein VSS74_26095 [Conexibacter stalactiti]|uniref:Uncharacterized protein n=1 Tax=Conexibacter stalactiti TaxID=1940611 RepID=A0ABU4HWZ9_9ACTN|nr:hypothetical protein [Conexibacter stalactiti]MDW5597852.1 hypothetical protein [Conexibacter stalactiti]MEC5038494.1 hypothetical protein [Conexibacter stalactiti]